MSGPLFLRLGKVYKEGRSPEAVLKGLKKLLPQIVAAMAIASPSQQTVLASIICHELFHGEIRPTFHASSDIHFLLTLMAPQASSASLATLIDKLYISKGNL